MALAILGALAAATTWQTATLATTLYAALALGLVLMFYRDPPVASPPASWGERRWWTITGREAVLTVVAGLAWATLNVGFILLLSFGP